ncbi:MAG: CheR family methyltransferase, partial [Pseudomonadales bacterium]|nr:CheR family methyltransferase [Pseudomonadales bacterium]
HSTSMESSVIELQKLVIALAKTQGLSESTLSDTQIGALISRRMKITQINNPDQYAHRIKTSDAERRALIEALLVHESWYLRDQKPFALLKQHLLTESNKPSGLRILSLGSASGEEPYSISLTLLEAGLSTSDFTIDAVDLSTTAITRAKQGIYPAKILREVPKPWLKTYFDVMQKDRYTLKETPRKPVTFHHSNLLNLPGTIRDIQFDAIFVRNVMIYLAQEARTQTLLRICNMLTPDGILFVGHSEAGLLSRTQFYPVGGPGAFAYSRMRTPSSVKKTHSALIRTAQQSKHRNNLPCSVKNDTPKKNSHHPVLQPRTPGLTKAKKLADQGAYSQAIVLLQSLLIEAPLAVSVYHQLGLIYAAQTRISEAKKSFQKALYLDSQHEASRTHLALILDASGEQEQASRLRRGLSTSVADHE